MELGGRLRVLTGDEVGKGFESNDLLVLPSGPLTGLALRRERGKIFVAYLGHDGSTLSTRELNRSEIKNFREFFKIKR